MKKLLTIFAMISSAAFCQSGTPQCNFSGSVNVSGGFVHFDNRQKQCTFWQLSYYTTSGISAISIEIMGSPDLGSSFSFTAMTATVGSNPSSTVPQTFIQASQFAPWVQVFVASMTGVGTVNFVASGWNAQSASANAITCSGGTCTINGNLVVNGNTTVAAGFSFLGPSMVLGINGPNNGNLTIWGSQTTSGAVNFNHLSQTGTGTNIFQGTIESFCATCAAIVVNSTSSGSISTLGNINGIDGVFTGAVTANAFASSNTAINTINVPSGGAALQQVALNGGANQVVRCTTSGLVLPAGTLTTDTSQCGSSNAVALKVQ